MNHRTGPAAHRALARDLVALLEQDMDHLEWWLNAVRAYPEQAFAWRWAYVVQLARCARMPLQVAEALLSSSSPARSQGHPNHRARAARPGAISATGANATIPATARRAGSAQTDRVPVVAPVSRPRTSR